MKNICFIKYNIYGISLFCWSFYLYRTFLFGYTVSTKREKKIRGEKQEEREKNKREEKEEKRKERKGKNKRRNEKATFMASCDLLNVFLDCFCFLF